MTGKRDLSDSENNSSDDDFIMEHDGSSNSRSKGATGSNASSGSPPSEQPRKRGRGPSKRPCLNRNALMARVNRQRKKEYVEKIETKLAHYRHENKNLSNVIQQLRIDLKRQTAEATYLRNVLNNNSSITALLSSMNEALSRGRGREENKWDTERLRNTLDTPKRATVRQKNPEDQGITCDPSNGNYNSTQGSQLMKDCNEDTQLGISDVDIEQLGNFDSDIFDISPNSVETEGMDLFRSNQSQAENLFENLDNSGICLHVNSGRISLEFCSICHLNSVNSDDP